VAAQHLRGDDEPADREEDVDAEEPPRRQGRARREVEQADADDGDDPQQFDIEPPRCGGRGVVQRQKPRVS
jgi:hypothetical protein